ncbi:hypothetical protein AAFF_G00260270 [Aldrovandia affinis]|uniref:Uncharacterized protein n=1 Tax=Aldrovandia affinis TaxID=143900 RepID=A0AAD7W3B8_9TELE|nr:hypothetical protein AAFF_G00260270 [Aldrovandia affinis]
MERGSLALKQSVTLGCGAPGPQIRPCAECRQIGGREGCAYQTTQTANRSPAIKMAAPARGARRWEQTCSQDKERLRRPPQARMPPRRYALM